MGAGRSLFRRPFTNFPRADFHQIGVQSMNPERHFRKFSVSPDDLCEVYNGVCFELKLSGRHFHFHFIGHLPQNLKPKIDQTAGYYKFGHGMHCREILFTFHCSPRAREFPRSGQLFVRRTVAELRGVKVAKFSDFDLFSQYKTPKNFQPTCRRQRQRP